MNYIGNTNFLEPLPLFFYSNLKNMKFWWKIKFYEKNDNYKTEFFFIFWNQM